MVAALYRRVSVGRKGGGGKKRVSRYPLVRLGIYRLRLDGVRYVLPVAFVLVRCVHHVAHMTVDVSKITRQKTEETGGSAIFESATSSRGLSFIPIDMLFMISVMATNTTG